MLSLIYKEFLLHKKIVFFALGYGVFFFFAFQSPVFSNFVYPLNATAVSYVIVMTILTYESKNNTDIILNSLPISRKKIILSRYLLIIISIVFSLVIIGGLGAVFKIIGFPRVLRFINLTDIVFTFINVSILSSIYYPLLLKFGKKYLQILNIALFMVIFFAPGFFTNLFMKHKDYLIVQSLMKLFLNTPVQIIAYFSVILALFIMAISFSFSLKIYKNKEF